LWISLAAGLLAVASIFGVLAIASPYAITTASVSEKSGDIDCDGDVDAVDALLILRHVAKLNVVLPPGCPAIGGSGGSSPTPQATPAPTVPPATFGDGTWLVGQEMAPGIWRNNGYISTGFRCYWERLKGFSGDWSDVLGSNSSSVIDTVEIKSTDAAFRSEHCGTWSQQLIPPSSGPTMPFGPGTWIVGSEIAPGKWRNSDSSDGCYWERLSTLARGPFSLIDNDFSKSIQIVEIKASDAGFHSEGCGTWTRIAD